MSKSKKLNLSFYILTVLLISLYGLFSVPNADDFCLSNTYHFTAKGNFFTFMDFMYFNWSGRVFPNVLWGFIAHFKTPLTFKVVSVLGGLCFSLLPLLILRLIQIPKDNHFYKYAAILNITLWLAYRPYIAQTVYWNTGFVVYTIPLLLLCLWIYHFNKISTLTKKEFGAFLLLTLACGMTHIQLSSSLLTYAIIYLAWYLVIEKQKSSFNKRSIITLLFLICATAILVFAPGNYARKSTSAVNPELSLANIYHGLIYTYGWVLGAFKKSAILFLTLGGLFIGLNHKIKSLKHWSLLWVITAVASMSCFIILPKYLSERTFVYFVTTMGIFLIPLPHFLTTMTKLPQKLTATIPKFSMFLLILIFGITYSLDIKKAIPFGNSYHNRIATLWSKKNNDTIKVQPLSTVHPRTLYSAPPSNNDGDWVRVCMEEYFLTKKIIISD